MDKKIIEIARKYAEKVIQHVPVQMVVLYGSYVKGAAKADSDIDIAIVVKKAPKDYLKTISNLFSLVRDIDKRIEPVLLVKNKDKSGFISSILKNGNIIYKDGMFGS